MGSTTKVCPDCAEDIKAAARVCRYCGHRFPDGPAGGTVADRVERMRAEPKPPSPRPSRPTLESPAARDAADDEGSAIGGFIFFTIIGVIVFDFGVEAEWFALLGQIYRAGLGALLLGLGLFHKEGIHKERVVAAICGVLLLMSFVGHML